ncbi:MAG TPA: oxaloacetate decarboxylase [Nocardioidaceae bacterium]|nr:oxaloacetate decarboxylase [Nocardioidaceae bacterium]
MAGLLHMPASPRRLRELLAGPAPVLAPGAYDALGARLIEAAGFDCVYMTGFGTAAGLLGRPDIGLLTGTEMVDNARRVAGAVGVPVVADADTGYGNPLNVIRTVTDYERAGVAGIHLEDQVMPKRCGHLSGKAVIDPEDMVAKVRAAVAARSDPDFVLIARTDARAVNGLDDALRRGSAYLDAGADVLFVEAPQTEAEVERVAREFSGAPLLFNWVEGGRTPPLTVHELGELGFRLVIFPIGPLLAATSAMRSYLGEVRGGAQAQGAGRLTLEQFVELIGMPEVAELEQRFS